MKRRILMVAGEPSGDALGAVLAEELAERRPEWKLYGVGGPAMRAAGVETLADVSELAVMGFAELGRGLTRAVALLAKLRRELRLGRPDLFVPIDFPDFNLPLCRSAARARVPVFYYVSPQVWAWRRGRIRSMRRSVTRMLVLFPFEAELYRRSGIDAHFVGHPLAERVAATRPRDVTRRALGAGGERKLVALLPGSRRHEVELMLPRMLEAAASLTGRAVAVVAEAPSLDPGVVAGIVSAHGAGVATVRGDTYDLVAASDAALVTSGTATLECALLGCPMVVAYRMSPFSHALAKRLVRVPFIAMPNLLLGREAVPELVQRDATSERMAAALGRLLEDEGESARQREGFAEIRRRIVQPGAAGRAAALVEEMLA